MKELQHSKEFAAKGYNLERFTSDDTQQIGPEGEVFKFYAAKEGFLVAKFETIKDASQWIEFK